MIFLAASSMFAVFIYCSIGEYVYRQSPKSTIHRTFLILCLSYAIWSFGYAFVYLLTDKNLISLWNKVAALGWCSFSAISLYLVLLLTEHKIASKPWFTIILSIPGIIFFYMAVFLFGPTIETPAFINHIFYIGDFIYNFSYLLASIILLLIWGLKSTSIRVKKQTRILVISCITPFILDLVTQTILPALNLAVLPNMGQLYAIIMILGTYLVIAKYKFLKLPESFIFEEVMREMLDMTILINEKGIIIKVNNHTLNMLGFDKTEVIGCKINSLIPGFKLPELTDQKTTRFTDETLLTNQLEWIPVNISFTPIYDSKIGDFLGAILVMQDLRLINELKRKNIELREKSLRDSLTGLFNHQYSIELLESSIESARKEKTPLSIMMLDIDNFKRVNDTWGHQFGDNVLLTISQLIQDIVSSKGFAGRYGGEEFIIVLPGMAIDAAITMGEKIRHQIKTYHFPHHCQITISIGIKQFSDETTTGIIRKADQLLYNAKAGGRDRVESWSAGNT